MIFDTHAHYDDRQFNEDRELLLEHMATEGVERIVNIGADIKTSQQSLILAEKYPFIYGAVGVHPSEVKNVSKDAKEWLTIHSDHSKCVAIGEIGLDYYWDKEERVRTQQKEWFLWQMELARTKQLPIVVHSRDAAQDTYDLMKSLKASDIGGVIHCFSYGVEMAKLFLNMGFYLGIGGVVTFNNAKAIKEVVAYAPLESIVLETDAPYLAPVPRRGKRNNSAYLQYVAMQISQIKGISCEEVIEKTNENGLQLYDRIKEVNHED